jgi:hypothetical protein
VGSCEHSKKECTKGLVGNKEERKSTVDMSSHSCEDNTVMLTWMLESWNCCCIPSWDRLAGRAVSLGSQCGVS